MMQVVTLMGLSRIAMALLVDEGLYLQTMDSYVANSMKEAGFRQAVMGRYPSETVYLLIYQPLLPVFL